MPEVVNATANIKEDIRGSSTHGTACGQSWDSKGPAYMELVPFARVSQQCPNHLRRLFPPGDGDLLGVIEFVCPPQLVARGDWQPMSRVGTTSQPLYSVDCRLVGGTKA